MNNQHHAHHGHHQMEDDDNVIYNIADDDVDVESDEEEEEDDRDLLENQEVISEDEEDGVIDPHAPIAPHQQHPNINVHHVNHNAHQQHVSVHGSNAPRDSVMEDAAHPNPHSHVNASSHYHNSRSINAMNAAAVAAHQVNPPPPPPPRNSSTYNTTSIHAQQQQQQQQAQQQQQIQQQQEEMRRRASQQQQQQPQAQPQPQPQPQANNNSNSNSNGSPEEIDNEPRLEGYERTNRIGQGAYGIVYRGVHRSSGDVVAIKRIPFTEASPEGGVPCNVIREISLLRELDHPNVVRLRDVNQAVPGELYLIFEFVSYDLKTFMDRQAQQAAEEANKNNGGTVSSNPIDYRNDRGLKPNVVKSFMRQILDGIRFCHTHRILHRDLKPHNLLISSDGNQVKLADFGLARLSGLPNGPYTQEVVTLWYRAPELLLGATRYSSAVDVWSVGCIFAEMATGIPLFPGKSDIDQLFKIFQRRGTPNEAIWAGCERLEHYNSQFPQWRQRHIQDYLSVECMGGSFQALDLLEQLLQYDPNNRLICRTALEHQYFFE